MKDHTNRAASLRWHSRRLKDLRKKGDVGGLLDELRSDVADRGITVRGKAAQHLGRMRAVEAVEPLERLLRDRDPLVRLSAAGALANIGSPSSLPALIDVLEDSDKVVRVSAISALGTTKDPAAIPHLVPFLRERSWLWARYPALSALLIVDDPQAKELAEEQLRKERWYRRRDVRRTARRHQKWVRKHPVRRAASSAAV